MCLPRQRRGEHFAGTPGRSTPETYWSATNHGHVIYESRLELARLLFADFDASVRRIAAQPFLLTLRTGGVVRKHIPEYLLLDDAGPVHVDVKPGGGCPGQRSLRRSRGRGMWWSRSAGAT